MVGAALRVMDTLSNPLTTEPELPLTEVGQAALRDDVLRRLGTMPFLTRSRISWSVPGGGNGSGRAAEAGAGGGQ